ncbi:DUF397 domain-containing protein [Streptomyces sp. NBC_00986]|uniref:DUF397 domain-containing protein n=1 Tax=Streptomyces sp. NBC_00986 TaxID=2903702 RepID=UPI00386D77AE|nr:DUF397 domain-containing protein [Streptomyces sp. NBC_00986]
MPFRDSGWEIANTPTQVAVRDTKTPSRATLTFPTPTFTTFVEALKHHSHP